MARLTQCKPPFLSEFEALQGHFRTAALAHLILPNSSHPDPTVVLSDGLVPREKHGIDAGHGLGPLGGSLLEGVLQLRFELENLLLVGRKEPLLLFDLALQRLRFGLCRRYEFPEFEDSDIGLSALPAEHFDLPLHRFDFARVDDSPAKEVFLELRDLLVDALLLQFQVGLLARELMVALLSARKELGKPVDLALNLASRIEPRGPCANLDNGRVDLVKLPESKERIGRHGLL